MRTTLVAFYSMFWPLLLCTTTTDVAFIVKVIVTLILRQLLD